MVILENIDIDIDKAILQNIDIDKISNRFKFGISNRATQELLLWTQKQNSMEAIIKCTLTEGVGTWKRQEIKSISQIKTLH